MRLSLFTALTTTIALGQQPIVLSNDKLELTIAPTGGTFQKLQLRQGDPLNPYHSLGHFLALDDFGAGMPFHGEASRHVTLETTLPLAQESQRNHEQGVAHALVRAASTLLSMPVGAQRCRDESRHGTQECVGHRH